MQDARRTTVRDRQGREYTLLEGYSDESAYYLHLLFRDRRVGYARCSIRGSEMILSDIHLKDRFVPPPTSLAQVLRRKVIKPKPINLRGRGLGSELLKGVIKEARRRSLERVIGDVTPDDQVENARLLAWYERHGFGIIGQTSDERQSRLRIGLELNP